MYKKFLIQQRKYLENYVKEPVITKETTQGPTISFQVNNDCLYETHQVLPFYIDPLLCVTAMNFKNCGVLGKFLKARKVN